MLWLLLAVGGVFLVSRRSSATSTAAPTPTAVAGTAPDSMGETTTDDAAVPGQVANGYNPQPDPSTAEVASADATAQAAAGTAQVTQADADSLKSAYITNPNLRTLAAYQTAAQAAAAARNAAQAAAINAHAVRASSAVTTTGLVPGVTSPYPKLRNGLQLGPLGTNSPAAINAYNAEMRLEAAQDYQTNPNPVTLAKYQQSLGWEYDPQ